MRKYYVLKVDSHKCFIIDANDAHCRSIEKCSSGQWLLAYFKHYRLITE